MITGTYDELKEIPNTHRCPEHDNPLTVAQHPKENTLVIRCGHGHYPEEIIPVETKTQLFKRGELEKVDPEFSLMPTKDLGDDKVLSADQIQGLINYAIKYGLDAYRGHVQLMYGKPYIGIDGYLFRLSQDQMQYDLSSRPLTTPERKDYMIEEGSHAWIAYLKIDGTRIMVSGLGIVTKDELEATAKGKPYQKRSPVVAAHPWQMAQKRAEWQACRRGVPIGESPEGKED